MVKLKRVKKMKKTSTRGRGVKPKESLPPPPPADTDTGVLVMPGSGTGERIKTSLFIDHSILAEAKRCARVMGLSFNAFTTMALFQTCQTLTNPAIPSGSRSPSSITIHARPHVPASSPQERPLGEAFAVHDDNEVFTCAWPKVLEFYKTFQTHPDLNWMQIGKKLRLTENEARAADLAIETEDFRRYFEGEGR